MASVWTANVPKFEYNLDGASTPIARKGRKNAKCVFRDLLGLGPQRACRPLCR